MRIRFYCSWMNWTPSPALSPLLTPPHFFGATPPSFCTLSTLCPKLCLLQRYVRLTPNRLRNVDAHTKVISLFRFHIEFDPSD